MKKGFTTIGVQIPNPVKAFYESEAKRLMVTVSAVVRAVLADHAKAQRAASKEKPTPELAIK